MKPIIILPPGSMSKEDIAMLNANDLCIVECSDPAKVKFLDPIPACGARDKVDQAAIALSRVLLNYDGTNNRADVCKKFVDILIQGTPLDQRQTIEEAGEELFDGTYLEEMQRLATEQAQRDYAEAQALKAKQKADEKAAKKQIAPREPNQPEQG